MPYFKISRPPIHSNKNTGSVKDLADYLEKENIGKDTLDKEYFFNQNENIVMREEVVDQIDNNRKGLKNSETKFYEMSLSFSEKELNHLTSLAPDKQSRHSAIRDYVRVTMDEYARHFDRGLTGDDIVWFAKIEKDRRYHPSDISLKEIFKTNYNVKAQLAEIPDSATTKIKALESQLIRDRNGTVILPGNKKAGDNTHVHIIVSRRDRSQSISLSPLANSRGGNNKLNGKQVKIGFNRDEFVAKIEKHFDERFQYTRQRTEQYRDLRTAKSLQSNVRDIIHAVDEPEKFAERYATKLVKQTINKHISSYLRQNGMQHLVLPLQQMVASNRANLVNLAARHLSNDLITKGAIQGLATSIPVPVGAVMKSITVAYSLLSNPRTKGKDKGMALER